MIVEKEDAQFFRNRENTVSVDTGDEFAGHTKSPFLIIHVATGRTETALTVYHSEDNQRQPRQRKDRGNGSCV